MDWELYERQRATLAFIGLAFLCFLLLAFERSSPVQHLKSFFVRCTLPTQRLFSQIATVPSTEAVPTPTPIANTETPMPNEVEGSGGEHLRALELLRTENRRLTDLLELKRQRWPRLAAAHVVNRDPLRWFQEILLDKGQSDRVQVDDPVIAFAGNREALVGRIVEAGPHNSRVMLIQDSLSSVTASLAGVSGEDGVVEGSNSHDLYLRYLKRDSQVKIGDLVVTSGLGGVFPENIPIGWVEDIGLDQRQLFLQARLRAAVVARPLRVVGILIKKEE